MSRSSSFLDSFWKLSRKNNIPDNWLVRDQDLDNLAIVLREPDSERRLRMLKRLRRFMTSYPPYWYYTARTQQQLGRLDEAMETYRRLSEIGSGHFRQDDMLAGSLANMALIQESKGDPAAVQTALQSADHSNRNWEANLVCAWVLGRHARHADAEDRILCNLDDELETSQSTIALVSLYYHSGDGPRLARLLQNEQVASAVPIPGLLLCARMLGSDELPLPASNRLASTLRAEYRPGLRSDVLMLSAAPGWKLRDARPEVRLAGHNGGHAKFERREKSVVAVFRVPAEESDEFSNDVKLTLRYPGIPPIRVTLSTQAAGTGQASRLKLDSRSRIALGVEMIEVDGVQLSVRVPDGDGNVRGAGIESGQSIRS